MSQASKLQRYEIIDVVGSGGMATVWRARDLVLDRTIALKRPHPAPVDSEILLRFEREARIAATVSHPNLVAVYDAGEDDLGPYLVMEYVDGSSLADSRPAADEVLTIGTEVAAALAVLHRAGIVHRDVKPANILLAPNGAKLTDFGIARSAVETAVLTQAHLIHATPAYAAPEVLERGHHSPSSDVYSLGFLLFERLAGERFSASLGMIGPGRDTPGSVEPWSVLVRSALSADPHDRPTAEAFSAALAALHPPARAVPPVVGPIRHDPESTALLGTESGSAIATPPAVRSGSDVSRGTAWVLAIAAVLALAMGLTLAGLGNDNDEPSESNAPNSAVSEPAASADSSIPSTAAPSLPDSLPATESGPTTTAEPTVTTTVADPAPASSIGGEIEALQTQLSELVASLSDDEIGEKQARTLNERVDEAVAAFFDGDTKKVEQRLRDAAKRIDKDIESDRAQDEAATLLSELADQLGASFAD